MYTDYLHDLELQNALMNQRYKERSGSSRHPTAASWQTTPWSPTQAQSGGSSDSCSNRARRANNRPQSTSEPPGDRNTN